MIVYRIIIFSVLFLCLFLNGCGSRCWVCEKEKDSLSIEDYTEELVEIAFESYEGMRDLLGDAFEQYKNAHQSTFGRGQFVHVKLVDEKVVRLSSHNAVLNPYLKACDADNDLLITNLEVEQFHEKSAIKENPQ